MCSVCTPECSKLCEVGLSAIRGAEAAYPTDIDKRQFASEKAYPVDFSHFNINGRVFGALGIADNSDSAHPMNVDLSTEIGYYHPIKLKLPVILPAVAKLDWADYFSGAALAGVPAVIGEAVIGKDAEVEYCYGKVTKAPLIENMLSQFRKYDHGYGDIVLQANFDDEASGVLDYAIRELGVTSVELKFGQAAKGIQAVSTVNSLEQAIKLKANGRLIYPDPEDPDVQERFKKGIGGFFKVMGRLPMYNEEILFARISHLRELGAKRIMLKLGGYDRADLERALVIASEAYVDLVTFDGAGGGTGNSPCKMMNEWGLPAVYLESVLHDIMNKLKARGAVLPRIAVTGGFSMEDHMFKGLAFGAPYVSLIGFCRAPMAAAMSAKRVGELVKKGETPLELKKYGSTIPEIFKDMRELRAVYGAETDKLPLGAIGVFSYLNRLGFGMRLLMALNRKFKLEYIDRSDIIPLTIEARELLKGNWFD